jgi:hypothetical protein
MNLVLLVMLSQDDWLDRVWFFGVLKKGLSNDENKSI